MENLYLAHYGVKGQKWGVRRYQNKDGTRIKGSKGERLKSAAKRVGRSAVTGAMGGAAAAAVTLAFAAAAPGMLPSSAVVAVGKTIATRTASSVGFALANEVMDSPEFKKGKDKFMSTMKGGVK